MARAKALWQAGLCGVQGTQGKQMGVERLMGVRRQGLYHTCNILLSVLCTQHWLDPNCCFLLPLLLMKCWHGQLIELELFTPAFFSTALFLLLREEMGGSCSPLML